MGWFPMELLRNFLHEDEGQDLIEYALLLTLMVLAAIASLEALATSTNRTFLRASRRLVRQKVDNTDDD